MQIKYFKYNIIRVDYVNIVTEYSVKIVELTRELNKYYNEGSKK